MKGAFFKNRGVVFVLPQLELMAKRLSAAKVQKRVARLMVF